MNISNPPADSMPDSTISITVESTATKTQTENTAAVPQALKDYFFVANKYFPNTYQNITKKNICEFLEKMTGHTFTKQECAKETNDFAQADFFDHTSADQSALTALPLLEKKEVDEFNFVDTSIVIYQGQQYERAAECAATGTVQHYQIPQISDPTQTYGAEGILYTTLDITHMYCASILRNPKTKETILTGEIYHQGQIKGITAFTQFFAKDKEAGDVEYSALRQLPPEMTWWME